VKSLRKIELSGKKVFLRVDWNVPLKRGKIIDPNRIEATIPTIKYLVDRHCRLIIGTHVGRPDGEIVYSLSTKILAKEFSRIASMQVSATNYIIESDVRKHVNKMGGGDILVLGNLRWQPEEEYNNPAFAQVLASYADLYVNDAFAVSHRAHASVEAITHFLPSYPGFLLEKEVEMLSLFSKNPRKPLVLVLGGAKIKDKIGLIRKFADRADKIIVGGAIANTIRYFKGENIGASTFEPSSESIVEEIIEKIGDRLILPIDDKRKILDDGRFSLLDIGPKSIEKFRQIILQAKTVFWNGNMGRSEEKGYEAGTLGVAQAISENKNITIAAGGDTVAFIRANNLYDQYKFVSTGGGATLEFLAGNKLPGLSALGYYKENS
jgi:3-phosphoglycerate kinase